MIKSESVLAEIEVRVNDLILNPSPWKRYIKVERPVKVEVVEPKSAIIKDEPKPKVTIKENAVKKEEKKERVVEKKEEVVEKKEVVEQINLKGDIHRFVQGKIDASQFKSVVLNHIKGLGDIKKSLSEDTKKKLVDFKKLNADKTTIVNEVLSIFNSCSEFKNIKLIVS
jgi:hypothetical protein